MNSKIKLHLPGNQGRQETLRWTTEHPASSYGLGVLLKGESADILDGQAFADMVQAFGAWIETDSEETSRKVRNALACAATGTEGAVKVTKA